MIDYKIATFIILYLLSFNFTHDAKADEWTATFHNATGIFDGSGGQTLTELNDSTNIGYSSNLVKLYWSGAGNPTALNNSEGVKTVHLLINQDQQFQTYDGWTAGDASSNYYPVPPQTTRKFNSPLIVDTFGTFQHNPEVLPANASNYAVWYPTKHFLTTIDELQSYVYGYFAYMNANPPEGSEGTIYGPAYVYGYGQVSYLVKPPTSTNGFQQQLNVGSAICEAGYSFNGNWFDDLECNLTNANSVKFPRDQICEAKLTNGEFIYSLRDDDCAYRAVTGLGTSNSNADSTVTASTPDKTLYIVSSSSGTVSVYEKTYSSANDTTKTLIGNIFSDQTFNYLQELNTSGNQTAIAPSVIDPSNGNNGQVAGGDTSNSDAKLDEIFQNGEIPNLDTSFTDNVVNPFNGVFDPIKSLNIPVQQGVCPTVDIEYFDPPVSFAKHCELFDEYKPDFKNAMVLIYMIGALRVVLSA